jgi:hypothetical protein
MPPPTNRLTASNFTVSISLSPSAALWRLAVRFAPSTSERVVSLGSRHYRGITALPLLCSRTQMPCAPHANPASWRPLGCRHQTGVVPDEAIKQEEGDDDGNGTIR